MGIVLSAFRQDNWPRGVIGNTSDSDFETLGSNPGAAATVIGTLAYR
jgi:hypothetical protein